MKRSRKVPLLVIGTLTLAGCDNPNSASFMTDTVQQEVKQEFYTSLEDCQRDWGNDPRDCSPTAPPASATALTSSPGGGGSGGGGTTIVSTGGGARPVSYYSGPRYYWDRDIGRPVALAPSGETRVLTNSYVSRGATSVARVSTSTVTSVARGGFGASAHGISTGG